MLAIMFRPRCVNIIGSLIEIPTFVKIFCSHINITLPTVPFQLSLFIFMRGQAVKRECYFALTEI